MPRKVDYGLRATGQQLISKLVHAAPDTMLACRLGPFTRGRVGGDSKPRPKQCPITSPDRPGPLVFQRATLKNWVRPRYEATCQ